MGAWRSITLGLVCFIASWAILGCEKEGAQHEQASRGAVPSVEEMDIPGVEDSTSVKGEQRDRDAASRQEVEPHMNDAHRDPSAIRIVLSTDTDVPGEPFDSIIASLLITDPTGHSTGFDVMTGQPRNEIPHSSYYDNVIEDPMEEGAGAAWRVAEIMGPVTGVYRINVQGTGEGTYSLSIRAYDTQARSFDREVKDIMICTGAVHSYITEFDKAEASGLTLNRRGEGSEGE